MSIRVFIDGSEHFYDEGTDLYKISKDFESCVDAPIALAVMDHETCELSIAAEDGAEISFLSIQDHTGFDSYRRSCSMMFIASVHAVYGELCRQVFLHFSCGSGFFYTIDGDIPVDAEFVERVSDYMTEMTTRAVPFRKKMISKRNGIRMFHENGQFEKEKLFQTRVYSKLNLTELDGFEDYQYGAMVHDTSLLKDFELILFEGGVVLQMPEKNKPGVIPEFKASKKYLQAQLEGENWAKKQGIRTIGDLNEKIINVDTAYTIRVSEALQESRIAAMAKEIREREGVRFVMIAGPSSSGKTTFSQRLCIQLSAHGLVPHYVGVDNYFINRADMIPGPDGKLDFEALEAIDIEQFNRDMTDLLDGRTIKVPKFDFVTGTRVYDGETMSLRDGDILVIEGIHCLNDALSCKLPRESKYKIYISALTQLNIDEHNRFPASDGRLMRRMVRDYRTRGASASKTIGMWESVRAGEQKNIFPFQEEADAFFSTALPYEVAALKNYVQPLLFQVKPDDEAYFEARRLLKFLDYVLAVPVEDIPDNSIIREFIGNGCFHL